MVVLTYLENSGKIFALTNDSDQSKVQYKHFIHMLYSWFYIKGRSSLMLLVESCLIWYSGKIFPCVLYKMCSNVNGRELFCETACCLLGLTAFYYTCHRVKQVLDIRHCLTNRGFCLSENLKINKIDQELYQRNFISLFFKKKTT